MKLLAFDTSTEVLSVAVLGPAGAALVNEPGGAAASARLLPLVRRQLAAAGIETMAGLDAIAFGRGPGAFTGLRTSCAVAQGLGLALDRPLLPLDSLLIVAEDARSSCGAAGGSIRIAVAMDARMNEIYGALYEFHAGLWHECWPPALYALADWNARLAGLEHRPDAAAGSAIEAFGTRIAWPPGMRLIAPEHNRAAALLSLARAAARAGAGVDAAQALPIYLRDKVALTSAERAQARATQAQALAGGPAR